VLFIDLKNSNIAHQQFALVGLASSNSDVMHHLAYALFYLLDEAIKNDAALFHLLTFAHDH
jgi:hypothetical protein